MQITSEQLSNLHRDGFLVLPSLFSEEEVNIINQRLPDLLSDGSESNIVEKDSGEVRTAMGLHLRDSLFNKLVRHPRLVTPALQIRAEPLYIQQVKVNVKAAFSGEI